MRGRNKRYPINQCALFRCNSRKRLFKLLQTSPGKFAELSQATNLYHPIEKKKKNGEPRIVFAPRYDLKRIQKRISELLMRLEPPGFLMSPVRGRSNIDNAARHRSASAFRLIDIADFYPNCSANKIAEFFRETLECPPDVVAILVKLTSQNGMLPQGSPASPILAYFAYADMWDEIAQIAHHAGNRISVYVDDVTISGDEVLGETIWAIKEVLHKHGHRTKDEKEQARKGTPVTITGVVLRNDQMLLPNVQHQKRHELKKLLEKTPDGPDRERLLAAVAGYDEAERQIGLKQNDRC